MIRVLFVCLGNICRSPMAEAVLRKMVEDAGLSARIEVDSAGTAGYQTGDAPHHGTRKILRREGLSDKGMRARKLTRQDLEDFDFVVAMDEANLRDIRRLADGEEGTNVFLLSDFIPGCRWKSVPDPWYTGNFDETFALVTEGCMALLERISAEL